MDETYPHVNGGQGSRLSRWWCAPLTPARLSFVTCFSRFFLACPLLLDALILVLGGILFNNLSKDRTYPLYW